MSDEKRQGQQEVRGSLPKCAACDGYGWVYGHRCHGYRRECEQYCPAIQACPRCRVVAAWLNYRLVLLDDPECERRDGLDVVLERASEDSMGEISWRRVDYSADGVFILRSLLDCIATGEVKRHG